MKFTDVIKKSVIEGFNYADLSTSRIITTLVITFVIALYIFFVYRMVTKSDFYFKNFNISMAIISVVTAGIVLAMQSSVVISLGMVGALSIVRFRTAIKDPMDLLFLFWSIGTGIICGAGLFKMAVILAVLVTVGILLLDMLPMRRSPYIIIINTNAKESEQEIDSVMKKNKAVYRIKSKNLTKGGMDLILEVKAKEESVIVDEISELASVDSVSMLMCSGEVKGC